MNNFSPRAQQVLALARQEANRRNHNYVGTDHLLLGLIKLGKGVAVTVLQKLGLDLEQLRIEVEKLAGSGPDAKSPGNIPYTPRVKMVLALSAKQAKSMNHGYVGTEHLLLGLLAEDGAAASVLKARGLDIHSARVEVLKELDPNFTSEPNRVTTLPTQQQDMVDFNLRAKVETLLREPTMSNFSPRAQKVLTLARKEADRFNHNYIGTEHLLLGLIALGQGVAANVLQKLGLDLEVIRAEVEKQVGLGPDKRMSGNIPYSPRVKKALALAGKEAEALGHRYVGTEHLLLGLLLEGNGVAARVLKTLGLDIDRTRDEVLQELNPNFASERKRDTSPSPIQKTELVDLNLPLSQKKDEESTSETKHKFTPRAQQALASAQKEAVRLNHLFVNTEHLLLGLINVDKGVAIKVLQKLGLKLENIRTEVEKQVGADLRSPEIKKLQEEREDFRRRKEAAIAAHDFEKASALRDAEKEAKDKLDQVLTGGLRQNIPDTLEVTRVLDLAGEEAKALNHSYIGTEHLLLALLRAGENVATRVLQGLGIDLDQTRNAVLSELDPNFASGDLRQSAANEMKAKLQELTDRVDKAKAASDDGIAREKLLKELEYILLMLDSLKTAVIQLRTDIFNDNS